MPDPSSFLKTAFDLLLEYGEWPVMLLLCLGMGTFLYLLARAIAWIFKLFPLGVCL